MTTNDSDASDLQVNLYSYKSWLHSDACVCSSLNPESFSGLDLLTQLDLSNNLLTNIHTQLFKQLLKIQVQEKPSAAVFCTVAPMLLKQRNVS